MTCDFVTKLSNVIMPFFVIRKLWPPSELRIDEIIGVNAKARFNVPPYQPGLHYVGSGQLSRFS